MYQSSAKLSANINSLFSFFHTLFCVQLKGGTEATDVWPCSHWWWDKLVTSETLPHLIPPNHPSIIKVLYIYLSLTHPEIQPIQPKHLKGRSGLPVCPSVTTTFLECGNTAEIFSLSKGKTTLFGAGIEYQKKKTKIYAIKQQCYNWLLIDGKSKRCTIYDHFDVMTSEVTQKLDKQKGATLRMTKRNDPGNCNGKQEADRFY